MEIPRISPPPPQLPVLALCYISLISGGEHPPNFHGFGKTFDEWHVPALEGRQGVEPAPVRMGQLFHFRLAKIRFPTGCGQALWAISPENQASAQCALSLEELPVQYQTSYSAQNTVHWLLLATEHTDVHQLHKQDLSFYPRAPCHVRVVARHRQCSVLQWISCCLVHTVTHLSSGIDEDVCWRYRVQ